MCNWPTNGNLTGTLSVGQGEPGKSLEYEWRGTELGIRVEGGEYQFVNLAGEGTGREIELQVGNGYIQWRYKNEEEWSNLIELSTLEGKQGPQGIPGKDGKQGLQGLPGRDGVDGKNGTDGTNGQDGADGVTPDIKIGTVTTLEAGEKATVTKRGTKEEPIFDFGIPKGEKGKDGTGGSSADGASIDDSTISKDKTWSSSKIEDFVLTNVGAIWKDITGGQVTIDSTMDGFLREVEISGNTTQDPNNLSDIKHLGVWNEEKQGYEIEITVSNSSNEGDLNYKSNKTTILTPCQLMKVGGLSDRLYWDKNKGRYVVEKNIKTTNLPAIENITNSKIDGDKGGRCAFDCLNKKFKEWQEAFPGIESLQTFLHGKYELMKIPGVTSINSYLNTWLSGPERGKLFSITHNNPNTENSSIHLIFRDTNCTDIEQMNNWVMSFSGKVAYYRVVTPELIETNITEELKLPTYINNTYISVNGGIQGSIKAKAPVDGGKVIATLQRENIEIKATNEVQDELINTTMLATDEMFMMLEPLLAEMLVNERSSSKIADMYVAMVQRGIKTIDQVPARYREQVKEILAQLEK